MELQDIKQDSLVVEFEHVAIRGIDMRLLHHLWHQRSSLTCLSNGVQVSMRT